MAKKQESVTKRRVKNAPPQLFPVNALWCAPKKLGGVDCAETCGCDDGYEYAVKLEAPDRFAAHNEWFCSSIANRVGLRCPAFNPVRHTDGRIWFGSQWVHGEIPSWWAQVATGKIKFSDLEEDWSKIYSFDLFINNTDRHLTNFLAINDSGKHRLYSLDYSRAWLHNGFPLTHLPMASDSKTIQTNRWLNKQFRPNFNITAAESVLNMIDAIKIHEIRRILYDQDKLWLTITETRVLIAWWKNES